MAYPGIYRAKALRLDAGKLTANIPQVFGDAPVTVTEFLGAQPGASEMGWVSFHGGLAEYPVWLSPVGGGSGGGTVTDVVWVGNDPPSAPTTELWYDTDEPESTALTEAAADTRYVNVAGDTLTGTLVLSGPPTQPLHAATKAYVDTTALTQTAGDLRYVNAAGDTMTGQLVINVAGNFHGIRLTNTNNTPFIEFRSNDAATRYSYLQGSAALSVFQADIGEAKVRALVGKVVLQSPAGVDAEIGNVAGTRFRIMNGGFEKAWIDKDGGASLYTSRISGGLSNHAVTLDGLFAAEIQFTSSRFDATGPAGNNLRGKIVVDGTEDMTLQTENLAAGNGDIVFLPRGTERLRIDGATGAVTVTDPLNAIGGMQIGTTGTALHEDGSATIQESLFLGDYPTKAVHKMAGGVLDYSPVTASQTPITTVVDLTGLSASFTASPERYYKITGSVQPSSTVAGDTVRWHIYETGAQVQQAVVHLTVATSGHSSQRSVVLAGLSGARTCKLRMERNSGTGTVSSNATATTPAFILVEDLGIL